MHCAYMESIYQGAILTGLAKHTRVGKIRLIHTTASVDSFGFFMRETKSVTFLDLDGLRFDETLDRAQAAQKLSTSISQNVCIDTVTCNFMETFNHAAILTGLAENKRIRNFSMKGVDPQQFSFAMLKQVLKRNSRLWSVYIDYYCIFQHFSDSEMATIEFYELRNKHIHAITETSKDTLHERLHVWPQVFRSLRGCAMEASIIFLVLNALGVSVGPQNSTKNRRNPSRMRRYKGSYGGVKADKDRDFFKERSLFLLDIPRKKIGTVLIDGLSRLQHVVDRRI